MGHYSGFAVVFAEDVPDVKAQVKPSSELCVLFCFCSDALNIRLGRCLESPLPHFQQVHQCLSSHLITCSRRSSDSYAIAFWYTQSDVLQFLIHIQKYTPYYCYHLSDAPLFTGVQLYTRFQLQEPDFPNSDDKRSGRLVL